MARVAYRIHVISVKMGVMAHVDVRHNLTYQLLLWRERPWKGLNMTSRPSRRLGYALVGTGAIAGIQAQALSQIPQAQLVAVYNHTPEKARALGDRWQVPWTTDYDDLLDRPEVEAVSICTPSGARLELAVAAAHAGKHVICEKPLEVTLERVDRIINACDEAGVQLGVIFPARFAPASQATHRAVVTGRLGQLTMASAHVKWHRPDSYYSAVPWRGTWALDGGGALMNQSIHWIDLLQWIGGGVATVCGYTARLTPSPDRGGRRRRGDRALC